LIGDEYVLVVAPTAGYFGGRDEVAPDHLRGVPLVGFRRSRSTELLLWSLRSCGVEPELLLRSDDIVFLRAFAAAGAGVAILPRLATEMADNLRVVRLRDVHTLRKIGVAYRSEASGVTPAVREFAEAAHRACGDLVHQSPWLRRLRSAERTS
jgi:DNA-binding transcriptional LysR family regulator